MQMETKTTLVLLGTGTPNAQSGRFGPALAVVSKGQPYIVDFGAGVVHRALEAGLNPATLKLAFLTHLHSDHTVGYPDLILTPWVLGRKEPLHIWGPPGISAMTSHILEAYKEDIRERSKGLQPSNETGWGVESNEIDAPGRIYLDDNVAIEAFPVVHGSWKAYGYKFEGSGRTIVVSSDTAPSDILIEKAKGCDILVHEVYSVAGFNRRTPDWQAYHSQVHTSTSQLAGIANAAKPGLLVLYHQLYWGTSDDELLAEIREHYDGEVVSGKDLDSY
ncbi:MBL fold metallo-hydrolase [bacterium]|nr:MBL fold metallo-hydrolase [bacterium]